MSNELQILREIEEEMEKLANAYEVLAGAIEKRASDNGGRDAAIGASMGALASHGDIGEASEMAARAAGHLNKRRLLKNNIAHDMKTYMSDPKAYELFIDSASHGVNMLNSPEYHPRLAGSYLDRAIPHVARTGARMAVGAGAAYGLGKLMDRGDGQTKAASLKAVLAALDSAK